VFGIIEHMGRIIETPRAVSLTTKWYGPEGVRGVSERMETQERLDGAFVRRWIRICADGFAANRDYLTQLDAAIGDADHGVNMDRGFSAAVTDLEADGDLEPGEVLQRVGATLIRRVGGAAGPLFGSMFREMGSSLPTDGPFDGEDLLKALRAGLDGIQRLGAAVAGDKTIVDAYEPALGALERELRAAHTIEAAASRAAEAAREGAHATIPMQARKGRASYLGPRSVGHQDPGATSTGLLFAALASSAGGVG
jgi:dihydroxyacetone kinase-like protein